MSMLVFSARGSTQNDAAQKAQEGDIGHWIEFYKNRQREPDAQSTPAPVGPQVRGKNSTPEQERTRERDRSK